MDENLDTNEASWDGNQNIRLASGNERSDDPIPIAAAQPNLIVKKQPQQPTQQGAMAELTGLSTASFDFRKSSHPLACFFTMAFKVSAVLCYILFNWIFDNFVITFITVSVLNALDFWVVKNISGRILVGLRWWIVINADGAEEWKFESREAEANVSKVDYAVFWYFQLFTLLYWILVALLNLLSFSFGKFCLDALSICLVGTNLYNYFRSSKSQQAKLKDLTDVAGQAAAKQAVNIAAQRGMDNWQTPVKA